MTHNIRPKVSNVDELIKKNKNKIEEILSIFSSRNHLSWKNKQKKIFFLLSKNFTQEYINIRLRFRRRCYETINFQHSRHDCLSSC